MSDVKYKTIERFAGYRFGDDGSVWSRWVRVGPQISKSRHAMSGPWTALRPFKSLNGYPYIKLFNRKYTVHRLILEAFIGPAPKGMWACHENGVRDDNRLANLRWDTPRNNSRDMIFHETLVFGEKSGVAKLKQSQVDAMRDAWESGN